MNKTKTRKPKKQKKKKSFILTLCVDCLTIHFFASQNPLTPQKWPEYYKKKTKKN